MRLWVLCLAALLVGCFSSEKPVFLDTDGACPVSEATIYSTGQIDVDGAIVKRHAFSLAPDGAYCVRNSFVGDEGETRELFVPLAGEWRIVQTVFSGGAAYSLARVSERGLAYYQPSCDDFTNAALAEAGVARNKERPGDDSSCEVTSPDQVRALFTAWIKLGFAPSLSGEANGFSAP